MENKGPPYLEKTFVQRSMDNATKCRGNCAVRDNNVMLAEMDGMNNTPTSWRGLPPA